MRCYTALLCPHCPKPHSAGLPRLFVRSLSSTHRYQLSVGDCPRCCDILQSAVALTRVDAMSVLRRCTATSRFITSSQPRLSTYPACQLAKTSPAFSSTSGFLCNTTHFVPSFASRAAVSSARPFHSAAYKPASYHHHATHLTRPLHPKTTTTTTTLTTPSPLATQPTRSIFRKGRKGQRAKLKSHSGSKKRFRFTRNGVIMRWRAGKSHKNYGKSSARLRRLSRPVEVYHGHVKMIRRSLPYGMRHSR